MVSRLERLKKRSTRVADRAAKKITKGGVSPVLPGTRGAKVLKKALKKGAKIDKKIVKTKARVEARNSSMRKAKRVVRKAVRKVKKADKKAAKGPKSSAIKKAGGGIKKLGGKKSAGPTYLSTFGNRR
jgi:uncharacterized FAD-dependent dehydrogenase